MKWLRREIHPLNLRYGLCVSEAKFRRELLRLGIKEDVAFLKTDHSNASVHYIQSPKTKIFVAIVCIHQSSKLDIEQVYALLVHEAVHIWREHCRLIGEDRPSSEFEAYGIQEISMQLMYAYKALAGKKR